MDTEQKKGNDAPEPEAYGYYPGCSLHGTAGEFEASVQEVARAVDVRLVELEDWNCCGASSAHMTDHELAIDLGARNVRIAEKLGKDLLVPCAACFYRLKASQKELKAEAADKGEAPSEINIYHLSQWLDQAEVLKKIRGAMKKTLNGLKLAPYYGCLITRPPAVSDVKDYENPKGIDHVIQLLGGQPVKWSYKTECCGGSLTLARADITMALVSRIVQAAVKAGAQGIVTLCPMCQANLESRQLDLKRQDKNHPILPVFFATELIAATFGESEQDKRWKEHLIDPGGVVNPQAL